MLFRSVYGTVSRTERDGSETLIRGCADKTGHPRGVKETGRSIQASYLIRKRPERYEPEGWKDPEGERRDREGLGLPGGSRETGLGQRASPPRRPAGEERSSGSNGFGENRVRPRRDRAGALTPPRYRPLAESLRKSESPFRGAGFFQAGALAGSGTMKARG